LKIEDASSQRTGRAMNEKGANILAEMKRTTN
jgi:hypothetical protein